METPTQKLAGIRWPGYTVAGSGPWAVKDTPRATVWLFDTQVQARGFYMQNPIQRQIYLLEISPAAPNVWECDDWEPKA